MIIQIQSDGQAALDEKASLSGMPTEEEFDLPRYQSRPDDASSSYGVQIGSPELPRSHEPQPPKPVAKTRSRSAGWSPAPTPRIPPSYFPKSNIQQRPRRARLRWLPARLDVNKRWLIFSVLFTACACVTVALAVYIPLRASGRERFFQSFPTSEWVETTKVYSEPRQRFQCDADDSDASFSTKQQLLSVPFVPDSVHTLTITGGASGSLTLASAPAVDSEAILYDIFLEGHRLVVDQVILEHPNTAKASSDSGNHLVVNTAPENRQTIPMRCVHFDITMYIPRILDELVINISTPIQLTFSPQSHIELSDLTIVVQPSLYPSFITMHESLHAANISLDIDDGRLTGGLSIGNSVKISNAKGDTDISVIPNTSKDPSRPAPAFLYTETSTGSVMVTYLQNKAYRKRKIYSYHQMGIPTVPPLLETKFNYAGSGFNGTVFTNSTQYEIKGDSNVGYSGPTWQRVTRKSDLPPVEFTGIWDDGEPLKLDNDGPWDYFYGNLTGPDRLYVENGRGKIQLAPSY